MEFFQDIINAVTPIFKNIWVQMGLLILFATGHGYGAAWLAVRMLFRPRRPFKVFGITLFPQGMIPRHRERLAVAIGKAIGEELVSQETIQNELIGKDFLRNKIQSVVDSYTNELLAQDLPSLIDALPANVREPILDTISGLQLRIAEHIEAVVQSDDALESIRGFVTRRVDDILGKRVSEVIDDDTFEKIVKFLEGRIHGALESKDLEKGIREFIGSRIDFLIDSKEPIGMMFTADVADFLKQKANEQIEPAIHQLTEIAAAEKTRTQIGALIKHEVHAYYENLPFFKKIFVSRETLLDEVDDLVNESLPKRIDETLRGELFAKEAEAFLAASIDYALAKPLAAIMGTIEPTQLAGLKNQASSSIISLIKGEHMREGISRQLRETLEKLRPHSIDAIMQFVYPESEEKLKSMLAGGLMQIIKQKETSNIINEMLGAQIDRLLSEPIGKLGQHLPEAKIRSASAALTEAIVSATSAKLPDAIIEFDIGGVVREKIKHYPAEKLETLVMSVAKEHLRTIELFGALFGLFIGIIQAVQFYFYAR